jgi:hypothetical protein
MISWFINIQVKQTLIIFTHVLVNSLINDEVCDATEYHSSNAARPIKKIKILVS